MGVQNKAAFAKSLSSIWIGSFHLFAYVARFQRQKIVVENPPKETIKVVAPGLEKHAGSNAFKKVDDSVSKFMFFEDDRSKAMSMGQVCITTKQLEFISEVVKVAIHGEVYEVHIYELGSLIINLDDASHNLKVDSKVDVASANEEESECEVCLEGDWGVSFPFGMLMFSLKIKYGVTIRILVCKVLLDLPLGGRSFTWMNKEGTKMSKLDWFLVSSSVMDAFQDLKVTALPRGWSSVLVNGSPSTKILISRGLRQGDPLSPFLFLVIMEGLNIALKDTVGSGLVHGLNINISKSNMYGIGVSSEEIENIARATGCASGSLPFIYLGLPIGSNMNLIANWQFMIDRFHRKLSTWKANMLSIGGHFTLIKAGGSGDNKKMSWIKWDNILASNDKGGLGIGSLKAFNLALLQK
nr:putative RNA-directed DNA polymerase, eukaryota, reverse transcriptase zinc-binding domain protein [Tanacetum cinerariifolium]